MACPWPLTHTYTILHYLWDWCRALRLLAVHTGDTGILPTWDIASAIASGCFLPQLRGHMVGGKVFAKVQLESIWYRMWMIFWIVMNYDEFGIGFDDLWWQMQFCPLKWEGLWASSLRLFVLNGVQENELGECGNPQNCTAFMSFAKQDGQIRFSSGCDMAMAVAVEVRVSRQSRLRYIVM